VRQWNFHHLGIPTDEVKEGESYNPKYKFYSIHFEANPYRIQWLRFPKESTLPKIITHIPHLAFKVEDLDAEIEGKKVILDPWEPLDGFQAAIIEDEGAPIEFI